LAFPHIWHPCNNFVIIDDFIPYSKLKNAPTSCSWQKRTVGANCQNNEARGKNEGKLCLLSASLSLKVRCALLDILTLDLLPN
jgi:hypothetical protein